jgi:hypothetical protein
MATARPLTWNDSVEKYWDGIADKFPSMKPPIRPLPEETQFLADCIQDVPKGDMLVLGTTIESAYEGAKNGFKVFVPDFAKNMRAYFVKAASEEIPQTHHPRIAVMNNEWQGLMTFWSKSIAKAEPMRYFSLTDTLMRHSGEKTKVIAGDGSLAFLDGPGECERLLKAARNIIDDDGVFVVRVGVHEPDKYETIAWTPQRLVERTKDVVERYKDDPDKLFIEKERLNREFCYCIYRPPPQYKLDYVYFQRNIKVWVEKNWITEEDGRLIEKPLAKLGDFREYVPHKRDLERMFKDTGFKIEGTPKDIVGCHKLSYRLTPA